MQIDHPRFVSAEIEYTYLNGAKGNWPVRTLRIRVDGALSNSKLAGEILDIVNQRVNSDDRKHFDHVSIVGAAVDWTADRLQRQADSEEFLATIFGDLRKA
jgi:hypothetical protein